MVRRARVSLVVIAIMAVGIAGCSSDDDSADVDRTVPDTQSSAPGPSSPACSTETVAEGSDGREVAAVINRLADELDLTTVLYRVTRAGAVVASGAHGDNRPGSPADTSLHFRIGNVAFGYMGTLLLHYVETGEASLDDPISRWFPSATCPQPTR